MFKMGDLQDIINMSNTAKKYLLEYDTLLTYTEMSINKYLSDKSEASSNMMHSSKLSQLNNSRTSSFSYSEGQLSEISSNSSYNNSDSSFVNGIVNCELTPMDYSISTGKKPLSLIIKRCSTPIVDNESLPDTYIDAELSINNIVDQTNVIEGNENLQESMEINGSKLCDNEIKLLDQLKPCVGESHIGLGSSNTILIGSSSLHSLHTNNEPLNLFGSDRETSLLENSTIESVQNICRSDCSVVILKECSKLRINPKLETGNDAEDEGDVIDDLMLKAHIDSSLTSKTQSGKVANSDSNCEGEREDLPNTQLEHSNDTLCIVKPNFSDLFNKSTTCVQSLNRNMFDVELLNKVEDHYHGSNVVILPESFVTSPTITSVLSEKTRINSTSLQLNCEEPILNRPNKEQDKSALALSVVVSKPGSSPKCHSSSPSPATTNLSNICNLQEGIQFIPHERDDINTLTTPAADNGTLLVDVGCQPTEMEDLLPACTTTTLEPNMTQEMQTDCHEVDYCDLFVVPLSEDQCTTTIEVDNVPTIVESAVTSPGVIFEQIQDNDQEIVSYSSVADSPQIDDSYMQNDDVEWWLTSTEELKSVPSITNPVVMLHEMQEDDDAHEVVNYDTLESPEAIDGCVQSDDMDQWSEPVEELKSLAAIASPVIILQGIEDNTIEAVKYTTITSPIIMLQGIEDNTIEAVKYTAITSPVIMLQGIEDNTNETVKYTSVDLSASLTATDCATNVDSEHLYTSTVQLMSVHETSQGMEANAHEVFNFNTILLSPARNNCLAVNETELELTTDEGHLIPIVVDPGVILQGIQSNANVTDKDNSLIAADSFRSDQAECMSIEQSLLIECTSENSIEPRFDSDNKRVKVMCNSPTYDLYMSYTAENGENSPILFSSEDELEFNSEADQEGEIPSAYEMLLSRENLRLTHLQELLSGVPPPPSVTIPQISMPDMLGLLRENLQALDLTTPTEEQHPVKCSIKPMSRLEDVLTARWPEARLNCYHGIHYNLGLVSEEMEANYQRLQKRLVGCETTSSLYPGHLSLPPVRRRKVVQGHSPGRRLSHLARRRQAFSSASIQLKQTQHRRQLMMPLKKKEKVPKAVRSQKKKKSSGVQDGPRQIHNTKLNSSKRALFQSPTQDKKNTSSSSASKSKCRNSVEKSKVNNSKRSLWPDPVKAANSQSPSELNINGKRGCEDTSTRIRKCPRRLFDDDSYCSREVETSYSSRLPLKASSSYENNKSERRHTSHQEHKSTASGYNNRLSSTHKKKLLWAVAEALRSEGVGLNHPRFRPCATILAGKCQEHLQDLMGPRTPTKRSGSTSDRMLQIASGLAAAIVHQNSS